jgi:hypothetical protein
VILGLPPLDLFVQASAMRTAYRFTLVGSGPRRGKPLTGYSNIWRHLREIQVCNTPSDYCIPKFLRDRAYSTFTGSPGHLEVLTGTLPMELCFIGSSCQWGVTDSDNRVGAGLLSQDRQLAASMALGPYCSTFHAEIYAIERCARLLMTSSHQMVVICVSSSSALSALEAYRTTSRVVADAHWALNDLAVTRQVILANVSGSLHPGFNEVRCLAQAGTSLPVAMPSPVGVSSSVGKAAINQWCLMAHGKQWRLDKGHRQSHLFLGYTLRSNQDYRWILSLRRKDCRILVGLLTGHNSLLRHLNMIGVVPNGLCPSCHRAEETSQHFLCDCPTFSSTRKSVYGDFMLIPDSIRDSGWKKLLIFAAKSGRFDD